MKLPAAALLLASTALVLAAVLSLPEAAAPTAQAAPANARQAWARDLLTALGNPAPSPQIVQFVVEWTVAEDGRDGDGSALARHNPLNTTMPSEAATLTINSDGVRGYASRADGLAATVATLQNGWYEELRASLLTNDPDRALRGLIASPWAESHYHGGVGWPYGAGQASAPGSERTALVAYALSLRGIPYVRGGRSASGGDCSGTMQHIYLHVLGLDIGATTYDQLPQLTPIAFNDLQSGDLWFGQWPDDQHVGMVADVDGDGRWDLIHNGADVVYMHVTSDFLNTYLGEHTIGYRRVLP